ncbi:MAG: TolC family protein [Bdellovibrionota bacterium]
MPKSLAKALILLVISLALTGCGRGKSNPAAVSESAATQSPPPAPAKPKAPPFAFQPQTPVMPPHEGTKLDPDSLRRFLLRDDISVLESLNSVYKAKEQISLAHANLLPSVNVLAILGGGTFGLGGLSFLLPFLAPSNWYNLDASKHQLAANGYAFYMVELNEYASVYSLYLSMLADQEIEQNQQIHYGNIEQIRKFVESQVKLGLANEASLEQATAQSKLAHMSLLDLENSIAVERAQLRKILGFDLKKQFFLDDFHLSELPVENANNQAILKQVFEHSPEVRQIDSLIAAAEDGTWSASFDFLGSQGGELDLAGGSSSGDSSGGAIFAPSGNGMTFSFGTFPKVAISRLAVRDLQLRRRQIYLEEAKAIETTLNALSFAKMQLTDAVDAEKNARDAFAFIQSQFAQSKATLNDVITASELVIEASISRVGSRLKVDAQRVNLERILVGREFAKVPNCRLDLVKPRGDGFGWLDDIFDPAKNRATVDELCRARKS